MMYLITYTLIPKHDATQIIDEIKRSDGWAHDIDEAWMVVTKESVTELYDRLVPYFKKSDRLLIVELKPDADYYGWLSKDIWDWISQYRNY